MTKQNYLERMRKCLEGLPPEEIEAHLAFYEEMIDERLEEGMSEEEATEVMEEPEKAAEKILQELPLPRLMRREPDKKWGWKEYLLTVLLAPFWIPMFLLVLGLIIGMLGMIVGILGGVAGMIVGAGGAITAFLYTAFIHMANLPLFLLATGSAVFSVGILLLLLILFYRCTIIFADLPRHIITWFKKIFIRRRYHQ